MPSDFFNELVKIVEETIEGDDAHDIVERQCRTMGKTPEELQPEEGALIIVQFMTQASEYLSKELWKELDEKMKDLMSEDSPVKGKVRGIILNNVMNFVKLKRGVQGVNEIRNKMNLPLDFRAESWYFLNILGDILTQINETMSINGTDRSRDVGKFVVSPRILLTGHYWFGKGHGPTHEVFKNISEILALEEFSLKNERGNLSISFNCGECTELENFCLGVCEGIADLREYEHINIKLVNYNNNRNILLKYKEKEGEQ